MEIKELAKILQNDYENARPRERVVQIHLFGIKYGELIRQKKYSSREIIELADMQKSYATELRKGINLSEYVEIR